MDVPHTLALDSKGRLFVGDRWNNRIQIFDQDGKLLGVWDQFSRPSGLYIDHQDTLRMARRAPQPVDRRGRFDGWGLAGLIRRARQLDHELAAFSLPLAERPHRAPMERDQAADDGEAEPESAL